MIISFGLANVFQPASGSYIFGPTNRFWRLSPISSLVELWCIWSELVRVFCISVRESIGLVAAPGVSVHAFKELLESLVRDEDDNGAEDQAEEEADIPDQPVLTGGRGAF